MGLVAEFEIHCDALPLVSVAEESQSADLLLSLQFNHGPRPLFLLTATGDGQTDVAAALEGAPDVSEWSLIGEAGDTRRYQARPALSLAEQLGDQLDDLAGLEALATEEAIIERIEVERYGWIQHGWFADRDAFREFSSFWDRHAQFNLRRLTRDGEAEPPGDGLTDRQNEALRIAYELGYFEVPRRASLEDVARRLDISASAASERLRRAQIRLIEETVATTWPPLTD